METTVAGALARVLERAGARRIYGIIGTSIVDLVDELLDWRDRLDFVTTRHEQVAASAADAEYRASRRLSAAAVHAGPGFLNTMISLGIAWKDRVPMILVSGGVRRRLRGTNAWLEVDQAAAAGPLAKYYGVVERPSEAPRVFLEAVRRALEPPMGPSVVEVPEDLWRARVELAEDLLDMVPRGPPPGPGLGGEAKGIAEMLEESRRPIILACGELALHPGFRQEDLLELAERAGAYIVTSGNGRGACPEDHERCLGRMGFGGGSLAADRSFEDSDLVLVLGNELDDITTYAYNMLPSGDIIVVSMDPAVEARPRYYDHYKASPTRALREILAHMKTTAGKEEWTRQVAGYRKEWRAMLDDAVRRETRLANPDRLFHLLDTRLPRDRIVSAGQGTHILYAYNHLKTYKPGGFLAATNLGAMGYALPAGIGAGLSSSGSSVVTVAGDGELMMTLQDLETITREGVNLKIVLVNDNSYKVLYLRQLLQKQGRIYETLLGNPDFSMVAKAFGFKYTLVERPREEGKALEALGQEGPVLVEVRVDKDELPPLNLDYTLKMSM